MASNNPMIPAVKKEHIIEYVCKSDEKIVKI